MQTHIYKSQVTPTGISENQFSECVWFSKIPFSYASWTQTSSHVRL